MRGPELWYHPPTCESPSNERFESSFGSAPCWTAPRRPGTTPADGQQTHAVLFSHGAIIDLGTLPGGTYSFASGINIWGQVVGTSDGGELGLNPALFENGTASFLPDLPGDLFGNALAINDAGNIVGVCSFFPEGAFQHAVLWTLAHQFMLPTRPGR